MYSKAMNVVCSPLLTAVILLCLLLPMCTVVGEATESEAECVLVQKSYPAFTYGRATLGELEYNVIVDIDFKRAKESDFDSPELKQRFRTMCASFPNASEDFYWRVFVIDSARVVLLNEFQFLGVSEIHFLNYSAALWDDWDESDGDYVTKEVIVGLNNELGELYVLTHPNSPSGSAVSEGYSDHFTVPPVAANFNSMLAACQQLRELPPLCIAGLWAALRVWQPSTTSAIVSSTDELIYALRLFESRRLKSGCIYQCSAEEAVLFYPGRDATDAERELLPNLSVESKRALLSTIDSVGVTLEPMVSEYFPGSISKIVELSVVTSVGMLYRIEVRTNAAELIDSWSFLSGPVKLPVSF